MKSTYELLSIFLDGQSFPPHSPKLINISDVPVCSEIGEEYNLLDFPVCRRKISGLKLLSMASANETTALLNGLVNCKEIFILLDYSSTSPVSCKLFLKRILQAATFLIKGHPEIAIILVCNDYRWTEQLRLLYGETDTN